MPEAAAPSACVEVAALAPVPGLLTYRVPPRLAARAVPGARVLVPLGGRKLGGVIVRAAAEAPGKPLRDLIDVLDDEPSLTAELVALCAWIADYYEAPIGEVVRGALPPGSGGGATDVVAITDAGRAALEARALPPRRRDLLAELAARGPRPPRALPARARAELDAVIAAGWAASGEQRTAARVREATERWVELAAGVEAEAAAKALARAPRRRALVQALAAGALPAAELTAAAGAAAALRELVRAGTVVVTHRPSVRAAVPASSLPAAATPPTLSSEQAAAHAAIAGALGGGFASFLLHGITGSGKTEVYLHVIADALAAGRTAIVLVPEISLTPQLAARFAARFGAEVAILHSGLSERDRLAEWQRLRRGRARIAVGARSAVFAPVADLGVIVVDEEHDGSFKQEEGVRYWARDVALVRAQRAGAVCVLGSATPSLESFHGAALGRHRLLTLTERPTPRPLPTVEVIDLRVHLPDAEGMLSAPLAEAIGGALAAGDQVILFLNRRGFATFVLCTACGAASRCPNCSVSLTYHQLQDRLLCHYCGHGERVAEVCPACKTRGKIERKGLGTERVAAAMSARFPTARVARLDRDVASGARAEAILARVARREVDLLVGTQMVTKGHDFPGVTLVGVLCADTGLSLPDFRGAERTFQLLTQVAGRAGRGERAGRVVIQTYRPTEPAVACAARHDYRGFYEVELAARAELRYPPHGRLVAVRIDGPVPAAVAETAERLTALALAAGRDQEVTVLGPVAAPLSRLRGRTRWQLWLRGPDRAALRRVVRALRGLEVPPQIRVGVDVDPVSTL
ncbi:MAG: primosomal protein N' [Kofleriaceae bacterium]